MKKVTEEWLKAAKDDLNVIEKIIDYDYLSNIISFHSQQVIEKVFKAVISEFPRPSRFIPLTKKNKLRK
jgi:HEPN domain-containing protein